MKDAVNIFHIYAKVSLGIFSQKQWIWSDYFLEKGKIFHPEKYKYLESTPQELSNNVSRDTKCHLRQKLVMNGFSKKTIWTGNISRKKFEKFREIVFFNVHLKRNRLVYTTIYKSKKYFFLILMRKWIQLFFYQNSQHEKTIYKKNKRFLTHKNIYIWNVLLKSFPMMCRMIRNVTYNRS